MLDINVSGSASLRWLFLQSHHIPWKPDVLQLSGHLDKNIPRSRHQNPEQKVLDKELLERKERMKIIKKRLLDQGNK